MPVLPNQRHERYAQELAKGKSQIDAYEKAGYKPDSGAAARLSGNVSIQARVAELQQRVAEKALVTAESLMAEADEIRKAAYAAGQFSAAVAALKEKGVLSGKRIERREQGQAGAFDDINDEDQLRQQLITDAKAAGFGDIAAALIEGEEEAGEAGRLN